MSVVLQESEDKVTTSSEVTATIYNCSHHHTVHYAGTQINSFSTVRTSWTVTTCSACRNIPFVYSFFSPVSQKRSRSILKNIEKSFSWTLIGLECLSQKWLHLDLSWLVQIARTICDCWPMFWRNLWTQGSLHPQHPSCNYFLWLSF